MNRTKWIKLGTWMIVIPIIMALSVAATNYLTEGFTTVGPFLD